MATMLPSATAVVSSVSAVLSLVPRQIQQQQQQQGLLGVPVSTGSGSEWAASSSSLVPADAEMLHSSKAAGLLPQGLLDEIGHSLQLDPDDASADVTAEADGRAAEHGSSASGGGGVYHARGVSIGDCITPQLKFGPSMAGGSPAAAAAAAAPLMPAGTSRPGSLSNSSSAGSSNSATSPGAAAAVTAAAAAASAAASGSAAASLWLTAAPAAVGGGAGSCAGSGALSGALASQQDIATSLTSAGTSQHSWGIFSASSAEQSGAVSSHAGDDSELESERSGTPGAATPPSSSGCMLLEHNLQQPTLLGGVLSGSGNVQLALDLPGQLHSPAQPHLQQQQQHHMAGTVSGSCSIGGIPVRSLAAAAAAAAAASGIAPVDHDAAAAVQQLAAGLLPMDGGSFELCPRCGRLHAGGCDAARKATCPRCYRRAHLGQCWSRCVACNLVHAPGKCRACSTGASSRGRKDQQQPVQPQQQNDTGAAAPAASDEDLESFPSLSEGMAGSGAPAAPAAAAAAAAAASAAQPVPPNSQLEFGSSCGR
ncbi:hypothetical protein COO60DRAFT_184334 [Scenedesmus sp. NREL 46B-D3]|nr:hypothetical protein COO60DRAFT_184334 [Scenedesmus sp. NREL 46B-D3]